MSPNEGFISALNRQSKVLFINLLTQSSQENTSIIDTSLFFEEIRHLPNLHALVNKEISITLRNNELTNYSNNLIQIFNHYQERFQKNSNIEGYIDTCLYNLKQVTQIINDDILQKKDSCFLKFFYLLQIHITHLLLIDLKKLSTVAESANYFNTLNALTRTAKTIQIKTIVDSDYLSAVSPASSNLLQRLSIKILIRGLPECSDKLLEAITKDSIALGFLTHLDISCEEKPPLPGKTKFPKNVQKIVEQIEKVLQESSNLNDESLLKQIKSLFELVKNCESIFDNAISEEYPLNISHALNKVSQEHGNLLDYYKDMPCFVTLEKARANQNFILCLEKIGDLGWLIMNRYIKQHEDIHFSQVKKLIKQLSEKPRPAADSLLRLIIISHISFNDIMFLCNNKNSDYLILLEESKLYGLLFLFSQNPQIPTGSLDDLQAEISKARSNARNFFTLGLSEQEQTETEDTLKQVLSQCAINESKGLQGKPTATLGASCVSKFFASVNASYAASTVLDTVYTPR